MAGGSGAPRSSRSAGSSSHGSERVGAGAGDAVRPTRGVTKTQGTGLGMAVVRSVIDLHGGSLDVRSAPGQGTRVTVRLPAPEAQS